MPVVSNLGNRQLCALISNEKRAIDEQALNISICHEHRDDPLYCVTLACRPCYRHETETRRWMDISFVEDTDLDVSLNVSTRQAVPYL